MRNIMKYKGYWAEISYSDEDECFCGEIEGLKNDLISFEGNTVKELKKILKKPLMTIYNYANKQKANQKKQCKGSLNVRLGTELHTKAKIKSLEKHISINELIKDAVAAYLKTN